jgi:hypothetical protein
MKSSVIVQKRLATKASELRAELEVKTSELANEATEMQRLAVVFKKTMGRAQIYNDEV